MEKHLKTARLHRGLFWLYGAISILFAVMLATDRSDNWGILSRLRVPLSLCSGFTMRYTVVLAMQRTGTIWIHRHSPPYVAGPADWLADRDSSLDQCLPGMGRDHEHNGLWFDDQIW